MTSLPRYVLRAIYPNEYVDGYIAKIVRKSGRLFKIFQLSDFAGNHRRCIEAAAAAAQAFDASHPKITRLALSQIPRKKRRRANRQLPTGISCFVRRFDGRKYEVIEAYWSPRPGVKASKRFNVSPRRSKKTAIALAIQARNKALAELPS